MKAATAIVDEVVGEQGLHGLVNNPASDALRLELRPWGVEVVVVQPGAFDTDIRAQALENWEDRRDLLSEEEREL